MIAQGLDQMNAQPITLSTHANICGMDESQQL